MDFSRRAKTKRERHNRTNLDPHFDSQLILYITHAKVERRKDQQLEGCIRFHCSNSNRICARSTVLYCKDLARSSAVVGLYTDKKKELFLPKSVTGSLRSSSPFLPAFSKNCSHAG